VLDSLLNKSFFKIFRSTFQKMEKNPKSGRESILQAEAGKLQESMALGRSAGPMEAAVVMPLVWAVVAVGTDAALADRSMHFVAVKQTN
jgi:hypothetical protein